MSKHWPYIDVTTLLHASTQLKQGLKNKCYMAERVGYKSEYEASAFILGAYRPTMEAYILFRIMLHSQCDTLIPGCAYHRLWRSHSHSIKLK